MHAPIYLLHYEAKSYSQCTYHTSYTTYQAKSYSHAPIYLLHYEAKSYSHAPIYLLHYDLDDSQCSL